MDNKDIDLIKLIGAVWSRRRALLKWAFIGFAVGAVIAFSIPREYECTVRLAPESKQAGSAMNSASGIAAMMGVNLGGGAFAGINETMYPDVLKSIPFLEQFSDIELNVKGHQTSLMNYLTKEQSYPWWNYLVTAPFKLINKLRGDNSDADKKLASPYTLSREQHIFTKRLKLRIKTELDKKTSIIAIKIKMQDPIVASLIADSVISKLDNYMTEYKTSKARHDLNTTEAMLQQAKQKYYQAEELYAQSLDQNQNIRSKSAMIKLDRLSSERTLANSIYQRLASQVELNRIKLQEDTPVISVIDPPIAPDKPISPKRMVMTAIFTILFALGYVGVLIVKELLEKSPKEV